MHAGHYSQLQFLVLLSVGIVAINVIFKLLLCCQEEILYCVRVMQTLHMNNIQTRSVHIHTSAYMDTHAVQWICVCTDMQGMHSVTQ